MAQEFEDQIECLGENTEKYVKFSLPINKEIENGKTRTYKIKFIDTVGFMSSSLSVLADNLAKRLHKDKYENRKSDLEYIAVNDGSLLFKRIDCKKNYKKEFDADLSK